jgi:hypothetical protein
MAITPDQRARDEADYASAYNEEPPQQAEQTEDQAFGLSDPGEQQEGQGAAEQQPPAGADSQTPAEAAGDAPNDNPADDAPRGADELQGDTGGEADGASDTTGQAPGDNSNASQQAAAQPSADDRAAELDKREQMLRSWEGRLKAAEKELASKKPVEESASVEALEDVGEQAEQQGNEALGDAATQAADAVEDGKMTVDQAMQQLAEDFGEDFVKMIQVIATHQAQQAGASAADDKVSKVHQTVAEVVKNVSDARARDHFEAIADAHPDFRDVAKSAEFKAYIDGLPEADKANAQQVVKNGSARQIIKLLSAYKASTQRSPEAEPAANSDQADAKAAAEAVAQKPGSDSKPKSKPADEQQIDAAEGVRSRGGLKLPEHPPASKDSFEDAWQQF